MNFKIVNAKNIDIEFKKTINIWHNYSTIHRGVDH